MEAKWLAVHTRVGWERKVALNLTKKGIESYCPLNKTEVQWKSTKKTVTEPLFESLVFVRITKDQFYRLNKIPGIVGLFYWMNEPACIEAGEVETIKDFLHVYGSIRLEKVPVNRNEAVRVICSPLMNYMRGIILNRQNLIKMALPSVGFVMVAEVQKSSLVLLEKLYSCFPELNLQ